MNPELGEAIQKWRLGDGADVGQQAEALLEELFAAGLLHGSTNAVLLGEQYHLGGAEDTRRMAELVSIAAADRVVDLACYVGGPARQLARDYGCEVVGLDISPVHIAIAERLTALTGFSDGVTFICASADAVPLRDGSFTVAWSQCSIPGDLAWLREMNRLVMPGGRLAFTGLIRRERTEEPAPLSLGETVARVEAMGYRIISAEDISQMDFECGWLPTRRKLEGKQAHYGGLFGDEWVAEAYRRLDADIAAWREGRMGKGRIVAVKG